MRRATFFAFCAILLTLTRLRRARSTRFSAPATGRPRGPRTKPSRSRWRCPSDLISGRGNPNANGVAASAALDKALGPNGAGTAAGLQTPEQIAVQSNMNSSGQLVVAMT